MSEHVKSHQFILSHILSEAEQSVLATDDRARILNYLGRNIQHLSGEDLEVLEKIAYQAFKEAPSYQRHEIEFYCNRAWDAKDRQSAKYLPWSPNPPWLEKLSGELEAGIDPVKVVETFFAANSGERVALPEMAPALLRIANQVPAPVQRLLFSKLFATLDTTDQGRLFSGLFALGSESQRGQLLRATILAKRRLEWGLVEEACRSMMKDDLLRLELAQKCAQSSPNETIRNIGKFHIEGSEHRLNLGKDCALLDPSSMAAGIKRFGFTSEKHRFVLAKLCAAGNGGETAHYIADFQIKDPLRQIEIAKQCAISDGGGTALSISKFDITDMQARIEIADLCAQQDGKNTSYLIDNFQITDSKALIRLAKSCAETSRGALASNIGAFKIKDPQLLIAIAMVCARNGGSKTAQHIGNFGITNPDTLIEIAKQCAQSSGSGTAENIANFGIKKAKVLIEIAKLCAQEDGNGTARYIQNFKIQDPARRAELARLCAKSDAAMAEHIANFKISDQDLLIEIAKLCAKQNGEVMAMHIAKFGIKKREDLRALGILALTHRPSALSSLSECGFTIKELGPLPKLHQALNEDSAKGSVLLKNYIRDHLEGVSFKEAIDSVAGDDKFRVEDEDEHARELRNGLILWLGASLFTLRTQLDKDQLGWIEDHGLLTAVIEFRRPALRKPLLRCLVSVASTLKARDAYPIQVGKGKKQGAVKLVGLITSDFVQQGADPGPIQSLKSFMHRQDPRYGEALIELLLGLRDSQLSLKGKELVLRRISDEVPSSVKKSGGKRLRNELFGQVKVVNALLLFQSVRLLTDDSHTMIQSLEEVFEKEVGIDPVRNFSMQFEKTFGGSRNPLAIMTYAAKVTSLSDDRVNQTLKRFATTVLDETFEKERYRLDNNPHLQRISKANETVLEVWKQPMSVPVAELVHAQKRGQINLAAWLEKELDEDPYIDLATMPYLRDLLAVTDQKERVKLAQSLRLKQRSVGEKLRAKKRAREDVTKEEGIARQLGLEAAFFKLINANDLKQQLGALGEIKRKMEANPKLKLSKFLQNLEPMEAKLSQAASRKTLSVFETDNPMDLLLCGTEIFGSCQRVDGNPAIIKALLGYLMNGATRVLKLAEGPDQPFIARSLLRLLWDGKQVVLFRDSFYPDTISEEHQKALNAMAKKKAAALGVPLVSLDGRGLAHDRPLRSLGGPAPFDYSDSSGGLNVDGKYTIVGARRIQ